MPKPAAWKMGGPTLRGPVLGSAPASSSTRTMPSWPSITASCSAVRPVAKWRSLMRYTQPLASRRKSSVLATLLSSRVRTASSSHCTGGLKRALLGRGAAAAAAARSSEPAEAERATGCRPRPCRERLGTCGGCCGGGCG